MICPKVAFNISNYVYIDFNTILKESNSTTLLTDSKPKIIQNGRLHIFLFKFIDIKRK